MVNRLSPRKSPSLLEDRDESVVGALVGEVVVVVVAQMRDRATAPVDLEPRGLQEQGVERLDGRLTLADRPR